MMIFPSGFLPSPVRHFFCVLLLCVLDLLAARPVWAGESSTLSLDEVVRTAVLQAPELQARAAGLRAAEAAIGPAGQLPDPTLIFGIENLPVDGEDAFSVTRDFMTMRKVGVMQSFPRAEKRRLRSERAESEAMRERAMLSNEQLSVREAAARAWIAAATAQARIELLHALRPAAEAQLVAASAALTAGRGSATDGIAARTAIAALEDRVDQALADYDAARADLARWLPQLAERRLAPPPSWQDLGAEAESLLRNIAQHRELLAFAAAERAALAEVALARAEKRPDWSAELSYAQRGSQFSNMVSLQFQVGLPFFAERRQDPLIASKQALLAQVEAEREAAQRMHGAELRKAVLTWRSVSKRVLRYEKELLPLAKDRADVALAAYQGGRGELPAVLAALDSAIEQRLAYSELKNTQGQAWATLYFAFPRELPR